MGNIRKTSNLLNLSCQENPYAEMSCREINVSWGKKNPLVWGQSPTWNNHTAFYFLNTVYFQLSWEHHSRPGLRAFQQSQPQGLIQPLCSQIHCFTSFDPAQQTECKNREPCLPLAILM